MKVSLFNFKPIASFLPRAFSTCTKQHIPSFVVPKIPSRNQIIYWISNLCRPCYETLKNVDKLFRTFLLYFVIFWYFYRFCFQSFFHLFFISTLSFCLQYKAAYSNHSSSKDSISMSKNLLMELSAQYESCFQTCLK